MTAQAPKLKLSCLHLGQSVSLLDSGPMTHDLTTEIAALTPPVRDIFISMAAAVEAIGFVYVATFLPSVSLFLFPPLPPCLYILDSSHCCHIHFIVTCIAVSFISTSSLH
jgi:hypothetical protein